MLGYMRVFAVDQTEFLTKPGSLLGGRMRLRFLAPVFVRKKEEFALDKEHR